MVYFFLYFPHVSTSSSLRKYGRLYLVLVQISTMKLFVGNLSWGVNDTIMKDAFAAAGAVVSARVIMDKMTGKSRGFGFVEFASREEGEKAISMLDGQDLDGRPLRVSEAQEPKPRN